MAFELHIDRSEITDAIQRRLQQFHAGGTGEEVGRVLELGDGIALVSGLPSVAVNEVLTFENETVGLALNLELIRKRK